MPKQDIPRIKITKKGIAFGYLPQTKKWHRMGGSRFASAGLKALKNLERKKVKKEKRYWK